MDRFALTAFTPRQDLLENVTLHRLTAPLQSGTPVQAAIFTLAAGGRIVRHPATVPQILAVLEGSGHVSGEDGKAEPISAGEAVFWAAGEVHETVSEHGLTALVLEGDGLKPYAG